MADDTGKTVKLRLMADSFNLYHYNEDGIPITSRGFKTIYKGEVFDASEYLAWRLTQHEYPSPVGNFTRRDAVVANSDSDPYKDDGDGELPTLAPGVSVFPEADFGSTTVGGVLVSDPNGDLEGQRNEARVAEVTRSEGKRERASSNRPSTSDKRESADTNSKTSEH